MKWACKVLISIAILEFKFVSLLFSLCCACAKFFERLSYYNEESVKHHKQLYSKYMEEEAYIREQQMVVQHRLDTGQRPANKYEDFCLPAVFMPFKSGNSVYNPRAHKYFHPSGTFFVRGRTIQ